MRGCDRLRHSDHLFDGFHICVTAGMQDLHPMVSNELFYPWVGVLSFQILCPTRFTARQVCPAVNQNAMLFRADFRGAATNLVRAPVNFNLYVYSISPSDFRQILSSAPLLFPSMRQSLSHRPNAVSQGQVSEKARESHKCFHIKAQALHTLITHHIPTIKHRPS